MTNNILGFKPRAPIERQAPEWVIRLDSDEPLSKAEAQVLRDWLARNPMHREEFTRLSKLWRQANVLTELAVPLRSRRTEGPWRAVSFVSAVAASAVVITVLGWRYLSGPVTYETATGQQRKIVLSDHSSVQLNTNSEAQVSYGARSRNIYLRRGEARFSVSPDPTRPFIVYAAHSAVQAVGTDFVVRLDGQSVDVTVTKGAVDVAEISGVEPPANPRLSQGNASHPRLGRLRAGQVTTVSNGSTYLKVSELPEPEIQRRTAWQEGYLVFSGEPLKKVVEEINRYSPVMLEIGDPRLESLTIGGRFRIGDLDAVLDVLRTNFGVRSHRLSERDIRLESESVH